MSSRVTELCVRAINAALIFSLQKFAKVPYRVGPEGAAALFEGRWFHYSPSNFGCTGNLDFVRDAENETRRAMEARMSDGQVFFDVGAHGGVYTVLMQARFPKMEIHSFEPQPDALRQNLALNGQSDERVHAVAVGDVPGTVRMTSGRRSSNCVSEEGDIIVPMIRIDDLSLPRPDWIKIDIEGFELPALRGAEATIREGRPTIICEINHLFDRCGTSLADIFAFLDNVGYRVHRLVGGTLSLVEGVPETLHALGYSADNNFWFVPSTLA